MKTLRIQKYFFLKTSKNFGKWLIKLKVLFKNLWRQNSREKQFWWHPSMKRTLFPACHENEESHFELDFQGLGFQKSSKIKREKEGKVYSHISSLELWKYERKEKERKRWRDGERERRRERTKIHQRVKRRLSDHTCLTIFSNRKRKTFTNLGLKA